MIQDVKYDGYSANPSDYECTDGELAMALGVVPEDGALKPIMSPEIILTLNSGEKLLYIHTTSEYTHYIIYNEQTSALTSIDKNYTNSRKSIGSVYGISHCNAVGNTLLAFSTNGINYYLWKDGAYLSLGDHIPDVEISFGLVGHPRLFSLSDESKSTFTISFDGISEDAIYNEFSENNKTRITEQVMAKVNKFIAQETVNKGRFCFPFFVRYALRLYDGSLVCHSAPILMNPTTINAPVVLWKRISGKKSYTDAELDIMLVASTLDYSIIRTNDYSMLEDWTDIIKSVDIFISKPIYTFDQDGKVTSFQDTDNFDTIFIGRLFSNIRPTTTSYNGSPKEDSLIGQYTSSEFLDAYMEWSYSNIYSMYYSADRTYPAGTLHLPEFSEGKVKETVENTSTFYKLCSVEINDMLESISERKDIVIDDEYLQSLVTREVMTDDYLSRDKLYAKYSFAYNSRINLSGLERKPFCGFVAQSMLAYCTHSVYSWSMGENYALTITPGAFSYDNYSIYVYIKEDGKNYIVSSGTNYLDMRYISNFLSPEMTNASGGKYLRKRSWGTYFFYPNTNAYKMVIYNGGMACYVIDLKPHEFLNGAFAKIDYDIVRETNFTSLPYVVSSNGNISIANKIYTSEVNNPFYFPLLGINTVGTGEIMGICSAAKALSQGQFGQFPLYAFSTEGVWALEVSSTGTYSARQPITRDVCINSDSITQIDDAVLFVTDRGIMLISGSTVQCVSDRLKAEDIFDIQDLPKADKIIGIYNDKAVGINERIPANISLLPFIDFLKGCRMVYDYTNQRIIVYNPEVEYAYVYSLKSKLWGMMHSDITSNVNSYPEALAMALQIVQKEGSDGKLTIGEYPVLVNFSKTSEDGAAILMITRPFSLGDPKMFKTIDTIIQRGMFKSDHVSQVLYGSNDLYNWHVVWSSVDKYMRGFRGSPYKAYRLAIVGRLDKEESIYGFTAQFNGRMLNQPR